MPGFTLCSGTFAAAITDLAVIWAFGSQITLTDAIALAVFTKLRHEIFTSVVSKPIVMASFNAVCLTIFGLFTQVSKADRPDAVTFAFFYSGIVVLAYAVGSVVICLPGTGMASFSGIGPPVM